MITGSLKSKIDANWQDFYNENMAQTSDIVNQLASLKFIKMLDDKQNVAKAQAAIIGIEPPQTELTFKNGNYKNLEIVNGEKQLRFEIPYEDMRRSIFKNLNPSNLSMRIKNYVVPFIKDPENKAIGKFEEYAKNTHMDLMIRKDS